MVEPCRGIVTGWPGKGQDADTIIKELNPGILAVTAYSNI